MKKKLLTFFASALLCVAGYSQTTAYDAPDMVQCGIEVFDLTLQNNIVLGNQDPSNFTVAYFHTEENAINNTNPIADPTFYMTPEDVFIEVFVRVTSEIDDTYDVSSFSVGWGSGWIGYDEEILQCESYTLPVPEIGNYYTGPGGTGTMLMAGDVITETTNVYVYHNWSGICPAEKIIYVNIYPIPAITVSPLIACDDDEDGYEIFDVALIWEQVYAMLNASDNYQISIHETNVDAQNGTNALTFDQMWSYTNIVQYQQTLYVRVDGGTCFGVYEAPIVAGQCSDNTLTGTITYDTDGNGCSSNDIPAAGVIVSYTHNNDVYYTFTDENGQYTFYHVPDGDNIVYVNNTQQYAPTPANYTVTLPEDETEYDFCLAAANPVNDVAVTIFPILNAIPGMETGYLIMYENLGSYIQNGTITLNFDDAMLSYNMSVPAMQLNGSSLTFSYSGLQPFEWEYVYVYFNVMQPPTVQLGDVVTLTVGIDGTSDDNMANNSHVLNQVVVNSYDPNDIRVHEGASITPEQAEGYLHYTIRFQNEGTANAQNVRIETELDANLDWSTFEPIAASHNYVTQRNEDNVEFIFNGIDLPYADMDEPGSNGWVTYKIKPVSDIALGDSMSATAGIYFDFNEAIITNTATTTVQTAASAKDFNNTAFVVYPNPASGSVSILAENLTGEADVVFTDVFGKTVLSTKVSGSDSSINLSSLTSGMYFVTLSANGKSVTQKIIIK
ncbi:MAG: hypothetical protein CMP77_14865 [Flavobacterium sp.]|nr:hypothetical protein [Flavobacterium sp.]|tara:strand:+ start:18542 stop:20719 length:2178 start_codon:yes stop_codon:yes gene_type:complete